MVDFEPNQLASRGDLEAVSDCVSNPSHSILSGCQLTVRANSDVGCDWVVVKCLGVIVRKFELLNLFDHPNVGVSSIHTPKT